jgi:hypothetical protein
MLISMVLGSGKENTESLHANVGKAHEEGKKEMSVLKKPFRIELRKTPVIASYRVYLLDVSLLSRVFLCKVVFNRQQTPFHKRPQFQRRELFLQTKLDSSKSRGHV